MNPKPPLPPRPSPPSQVPTTHASAGGTNTLATSSHSHTDAPGDKPRRRPRSSRRWNLHDRTSFPGIKCSFSQVFRILRAYFLLVSCQRDNHNFLQIQCVSPNFAGGSLLNICMLVRVRRCKSLVFLSKDFIIFSSIYTFILPSCLPTTMAARGEQEGGKWV